MDDLQAKIDRFTVRYSSETTMPPAEILGICGNLLDRVKTLTIVWDAIESLTHRVAQLEKIAPDYKGPRG